MRRRCVQGSAPTSPPSWQAFIEGVVYTDAEVPWGNDPAQSTIVVLFMVDRVTDPRDISGPTTVADIRGTWHDDGTPRTELSTASAPSGLICPVSHPTYPVS
jgi:hypothetical protein